MNARRLTLAALLLIVAALLGWWLSPGRSAPVVPLNQGPTVSESYVDPTYHCIEGGDGQPGWACYLADDLPETAAPVVPLAELDEPGSLTAEAAPRPVVKPATPAAPAQSTDRIEEDEPGWDCTTMGNLICGPDAPTEDVAYCYEFEGMDDGWQCQAAPDDRPLAWSGPWSMADVEWHAQHPTL